MRVPYARKWQKEADKLREIALGCGLSGSSTPAEMWSLREAPDGVRIRNLAAAISSARRHGQMTSRTAPEAQWRISQYRGTL